METPLHKLVAARVGQYEGAYSTRKVAPEIMPTRLPSPTRKPVLAALDDSDKSLLLCLHQSQQHVNNMSTSPECCTHHECTRTEGMYAPDAIRKQAKYATPLCSKASILARTTIPTRDMVSAPTIWNPRSRK